MLNKDTIKDTIVHKYISHEQKVPGGFKIIEFFEKNADSILINKN